MDAQRLTDADFVDTPPPPAATDAPASDRPGGYPDWPDADGASLAPEDDAPPEAAAPVAPPTAEAAETDDPTDTTEATDAEQAAPEAPVDVKQLQAELAAERRARQAEAERVAELETYRQQQEAAAVEAQLAAHWQQVETNHARAWDAALKRSRQMTDAEAQRFLTYENQRLTQARDAEWARVTQAREQQYQQLVTHLARDKFYEQVLAAHNLPAEAREDLEAYAPEELDRHLPRIIKHHKTLAATKRQLTQYQRELAARQRMASGADAIGGRSGGAPNDPRLNAKNPETYDPQFAYDYAGQWYRGR